MTHPQAEQNKQPLQSQFRGQRWNLEHEGHQQLVLTVERPQATTVFGVCLSLALSLRGAFLQLLSFSQWLAEAEHSRDCYEEADSRAWSRQGNQESETITVEVTIFLRVKVVFGKFKKR
jgi:hypothetical protein